MAVISVKEIRDVLREVTENETKTECGEMMFELYNLNRSGQNLDLTSAVLTQRSSLAYKLNNGELSFSRFLSPDFTRQPVILVSKRTEASVSLSDDVLKPESTPTKPSTRRSSVKSSGVMSSLKMMKIDSKKDASDVWGSPLKCDIPTDDESLSSLNLDSSQISTETKKPRPKHLGIPLNVARKIISAYNASNIPDLPPLLVLCNGRDLKTTALMGVKKFQVPKEKRTAAGFKMVTLTVDEKGSPGTWNRKVNMEGGSSQACQAVYQVNADKQKPWGTVAVEIKWKEANHLLETPPLEARTAVKASVPSGNTQSCMNIYQELQCLEGIITAVTTEQMEWMPLSTKKLTVPLTTSVKNLIQTLQEEGTLGSSAAQGEGEEAEKWAFTSIPERKDYDFTDRLWKVMMDCMSTADLISSLRLVFNALGRGQLRPFVDRHNHSTVAQIVREAVIGRFCSPSLTGIQPLLYLAEMGAEKLRRDYIQFFVSRCLATPSALECFTNTDRELHEKLEDLGKLHSILEMVALLGASLRLPSDTLGVITRQMVIHYRQHSVDPQHVFTFPVKTSEVRYVLSSVPADMWCVEMTNNVLMTENVSESSLHCLSVTQPFLHLQAGSKEGSSSKENSERSEIGAVLLPVGDSKSDYCLVQRKESVILM